MKVLFIIGACIRLIGWDPWERPTYRVLLVGAHSYLVELADDTYSSKYFIKDSVRFSEQKDYAKTQCLDKYK